GRVLVAQEQDDAGDAVTAVVLAEHAVALLVAQLHLAEVADEDRRSVALGDDDIAHVLQSLDKSDAADDDSELAAGQNAPARIGAVRFDRVGDVLERQVEAHELLRIELELELGGDAAEVLDVGDPRHLLERGNDRPSLDLRKLTQTLAVGLERVLEDFTGRRGQWVELRGEPRRQLHVLDALQNALTRPVILDAFTEDHSDRGQPEGAAGAHRG